MPADGELHVHDEVLKVRKMPKDPIKEVLTKLQCATSTEVKLVLFICKWNLHVLCVHNYAKNDTILLYAVL